MSDSGKLRLVYGIICLVWSLLNVAGIITFSFLLGFRILPSTFGVLIFFLSISLVFSVLGTVANFIDIYKVGKYEEPKEIEKKLTTKVVKKARPF